MKNEYIAVVAYPSAPPHSQRAEPPVADRCLALRFGGEGGLACTEPELDRRAMTAERCQVQGVQTSAAKVRGLHPWARSFAHTVGVILLDKLPLRG